MELLTAAYEGRLDDVRALVEVGRYDVNSADEKGRTALHILFSASLMIILSLLFLYFYHNPFFPLHYLYTTLLLSSSFHFDGDIDLAACKNHVALVEYLMYIGADSAKRDINNNTPLHLAALGGFSKVSAVIIANSKPEAVMAEDMHGNTPLYLAHIKLKKMKQNFSSFCSLTCQDKSLSDVQEELHYIIDIITEFIERHGTPQNREKLCGLKQRIAQIQDADDMDEVDSLLQSLSL